MRGAAIWVCLTAAIVASPVAAQMPPPVPPASLPANCTADEHRQFDFWIGKWRVFRTDNPEAMLGASEIESVYNGCGIRENWQPFTLLTGGSLSIFDRASGKWHQTWIDSLGSHGEFVGGLVKGDMVLSGMWRGFSGPGKDALVRMTWSRLGDGGIRQLGETSLDEGRTWKAAFDFTYRAKR